MSIRDAYLAFDLGAESGRAMIGALDTAGSRLSLHEVHRFPHHPVTTANGMHWDVDRIWEQVLTGLANAGSWCRANQLRLRSVGVDTWGVDFGLIGASGELLAPPRAYRDPRNAPAFERVVGKLGRERIWSATGIQFMAINSLYQLESIHHTERQLLAGADRLLFMPDLFHYFLTGRMTNERTAASTSQIIDARSGSWATDLLDALDIPTHFLGTIIPAGSMIATVRPTIADEGQLGEAPAVVAPASHDTGSAVAAVPAEPHSDWCYISSGTWSCLGAELARPCLSAEALQAGFTNEAGIDGTYRFLTNVVGLWLVQECRREFLQWGIHADYAALTDLARTALPLRTLIDVGHPSFLSPGDMVRKLCSYAHMTHQSRPDGPGAIIRCCLEGLALAYAVRLGRLEHVLGRRFNVIHIVGGGSRNDLLNQMTADACNRPVAAGPDEATAIGNALVQMKAHGAMTSLHELRHLSRSAANVRLFAPNTDRYAWDEALGRLRSLEQAVSESEIADVPQDSAHGDPRISD